MKKLFIFLFLVLFTGTLFAQKTDSAKYIYAEATTVIKTYLGYGCYQVILDDGSQTKYQKKQDRIKDESGNDKDFFTAFAVLNYFIDKGWEYVSTIIDYQSNYHFILRRAKFTYSNKP